MMGRPQVFTIPSQEAFVDVLAAGLLAEAKGDPVALARTQVLLPNRRSVRALSAAFVRLSGRQATLLPRMTPLGDVDEDEALGSFVESAAENIDIPPAINAVARRVALSPLVRQWLAAHERGNAPEAEVHRLSDALAKTLDQLLIDGISPAQLEDVTPDIHAEHWRKTLTFLNIVARQWPAYLAEQGQIDGVDRRNRLLEALAARWSQTPPSTRIVAAGSTGSIPATARLLRIVARLPAGAVVLPGLDLTLDEEGWDAVDERHPQYGLKQLLETMDVGRREVELWPGCREEGACGRMLLIQNALLPAALTVRWSTTPAPDRALEGVKAVEAATPGEEAQVIALALRRHLSVEGETAALITPDRALARRVAAHLKRFGIVSDDSAGQPLDQTPPATLMQILAHAVDSDFAPVALLALLKHPLVAQGELRAEHLQATRRLDKLVLRGGRSGPGLEGVTDALRASASLSDLEPWWSALVDKLSPLATMLKGERVETHACLIAHCTAAEALCSAQLLWVGDAGTALRDRLADLIALGDGLGDIACADYPALFGEWLGDVVVRPRPGAHPRIFIWGTLEARLQRCDLMVLGGLNEGVWPAAPAPDPWLSPAIRRALGLPTPERRIGQAAHDFAQAMGARQVLLTRARKDGTSPTVTSRFWLRLEAVAPGGLPRDEELLAIARGLDHPEKVAPALRPSIAPPSDLRPRAISVTEVEKLLADPYAFYARHILKLKALDPLALEPDAREIGILAHDALEAWFRGGDWSASALSAAFDVQLHKVFRQPLVRLLLQPRLTKTAHWVAEQVASRQGEWRPYRAEVSGGVQLAGVKIKGRADRIDRNDKGQLALIDYKTGQPPSYDQKKAGYAPQMPLLALIAQQEGFEETPTAPVAELHYWKLGGKEGGENKSAINYKKGSWTTVEDWIASTVVRVEERVRALLTGDEPFTSKTHPLYARGNDYDRLARVAEWFGRDMNNSDPAGEEDHG